jgi:hypothetical protein
MSDNISNVVLVHGAWADGSSWGTVINSLMAEGLKVVAAPLPLTSMDDDVAALEHALSRVEDRWSSSATPTLAASLAM